VEAVAAASGLSPKDLAGIFRGTTKLEVAHLLRLAEALGMHPGELFYLAAQARISGEKISPFFIEEEDRAASRARCKPSRSFRWRV
jgi:transcriptional regulator with XRE-family HTH domain